MNEGVDGSLVTILSALQAAIPLKGKEYQTALLGAVPEPFTHWMPLTFNTSL